MQNENGLKEVFEEKRPWGGFRQFPAESGVTVKEIWVESMARLSLQSHKLRDEYWFVVSPNLIIELISPDGIKIIIEPIINSTIMIPRDWLHRLMNLDKERGYVIETSVGIFKEEDIERFADDYGRMK